MPLSNEVRIIGGKWKRRKLVFPARAQLRPTLDRVRETLFNWLGARVEASVCLDLYAGSGALGFEALSRGAARVVLVDEDPLVVRSLHRSLERLLPRGDAQEAVRANDVCRIVRSPALAYLKRAREAFDIVFLDPPFASTELPQALTLIRERELLTDDAVVYVETSTHRAVDTPGFDIVKASRAGDVSFMLLTRLRGLSLSDTIRIRSSD